MSVPPTVDRTLFEQTLTEQQQLVRAINAVEYHLYQVGDHADDAIAQFRQSTGELIELLRKQLFRNDQVVLPLLDALSSTCEEQYGNPSDHVRETKN